MQQSDTTQQSVNNTEITDSVDGGISRSKTVQTGNEPNGNSIVLVWVLHRY